jgi:hypothetical protein
MKKTIIFKRLYQDYSKKYLGKIIQSAFLSLLVAASTSSIAWLLDPAIKKIFIEKDQSLSNYYSYRNNSSICIKRYFSIYGKSHHDWCCRGS